MQLICTLDVSLWCESRKTFAQILSDLALSRDGVLQKLNGISKCTHVPSSCQPVCLNIAVWNPQQKKKPSSIACGYDEKTKEFESTKYFVWKSWRTLKRSHQLYLIYRQKLSGFEDLLNHLHLFCSKTGLSVGSNKKIRHSKLK